MSAPPSPPVLLPGRFRQVFAARGDAAALRSRGDRISYGSLWERARRGAGWLWSLGLRPGDRIAAHMPSCRESVLVYLASLLHGAVLLPLNPRYTEEEVAYLLEDAGAALFLRASPEPGSDGTWRWEVIRAPRGPGPGALRLDPTETTEQLWDRMGDAPPLSDPGPAPRPDDTALLCYTSGTTGRPKGAMITHGNLASMAAGLHAAWGWSQRDTLLHALPLFHVHGLLVALQGALYAGATVRLLPRFRSEEVLGCLQREGCTVFMGVPTMYHRLVHEPAFPLPSLPGVRLFLSGSAPLSGELFHGFRDAYGHTILERYGLTEAGMVLSNPLDGERVAESVGFPLPGVSVRLADPETGAEAGPGETGELLIRSGSVFKGYWGRPDADREAILPGGWFRSGDLARKDENGRYFLLGRRAQLIITGGFNVYPREVERVLEQHPAVLEAAVFGRGDPALGEVVAAGVVLRPAASAAEAELTAFCRERLTAYKCPRSVLFLDRLPRNAMGKVTKGALKEAR